MSNFKKEGEREREKERQKVRSIIILSQRYRKELPKEKRVHVPNYSGNPAFYLGIIFQASLVTPIEEP